MPGEEMGRKHGQQKQQPQQQQQSGNLGQDEAEKQRRSDAELKKMGEHSRQSGKAST